MEGRKRGKTMNAPTNQDRFEVVSADGLEGELNLVRASTAGPLAGIFGPLSETWRVDREAAIFLGAGRALLLQLAHPWVATAIEQHPESMADPIGRFHRTFSVMFTMVFGGLEQSLDIARRLHRRHGEISGTLPSAVGPFPAGSSYCANCVPALRWVHATLTDTALAAYTLVLPALTPEERECYYAERRLFAALFGIPQSSLPQGWAAFSAYIEAMVQSSTLIVTDPARAVAHRLLAGANTWLPIPASYQALTAKLLPPQLRDAFELRYGETERRDAENLIARVRQVYPLLPKRLRYVGPYQEAQQRLAGRTRPDLATQLLNHIWIGRRALAERSH
jgi:uncharacterized protein (DUF2236 family)